MFKKAIVLSLIGLLTFSSSTYADTEENNINQDVYNTYEAPAESNLDNYNQTQEENNSNQNNYNESEGEYYNNDYSGEQYNDNYYDEGYSEEANNNNNEGYDDNSYNDEAAEEEIYEEEAVEPEPEPEPELEPEPEEPVEVYEEPEPQQEEDKEIEINQVETEYVLVNGQVVDVEDNPIEDIKLSLNSEDISLETRTDEEGNFSFEEVPSGNYELAIVEADGYNIDEENVKTFEVGSRNKSGLVFTLEAEEEEEVASPPSRVEATDDTASSPSSLSPMDWTLMSIGGIFLLTGIIIFILKRLRA